MTQQITALVTGANRGSGRLLNGRAEVLADELPRQVKAGLSTANG